MTRMGIGTPQIPELVPNVIKRGHIGAVCVAADHRSQRIVPHLEGGSGRCPIGRRGVVAIQRLPGRSADPTPVRIVGMDLTIRAADGFRPTLVFDGVPEGTVSPGQMISLRGNGKLTLLDVDLRRCPR